MPHRAPVAGGSSGGAAAALGGAAAAGGDPLQALRNHPQINQLRAMVQSNPSALPMVLQQIGAASPQLLEIITAVRGLRLHVQCPWLRNTHGGPLPCVLSSSVQACCVAGVVVVGVVRTETPSLPS